MLVKFPSDETGKQRKLSQPWHGPYRIIDCNETNVTVQKVYGTQNSQIQVHRSPVTPCPAELPPGFFWYGRKHHCPGNRPQWVKNLFVPQSPTNESHVHSEDGERTLANDGVESEGVEHGPSDSLEHCEDEDAPIDGPRSNPRDQEDTSRSDLDDDELPNTPGDAEPMENSSRQDTEAEPEAGRGVCDTELHPKLPLEQVSPKEAHQTP